MLEWKEVIYEDGDEDLGMDLEIWDVFLLRIKEEKEVDFSILSGIVGVKKRVRIGFWRKVIKVF